MRGVRCRKLSIVGRCPLKQDVRCREAFVESPLKESVRCRELSMNVLL